MKVNYLSPTIFNAADMNLSQITRKDTSLSIEEPIDGAWLPAVALSASMRVIIGRKEIGQKMDALVDRKF